MISKAVGGASFPPTFLKKIIGLKHEYDPNMPKIPGVGEIENEAQHLIVDDIIYPFRDESDIMRYHDAIIDVFGGARGIIIEGTLSHAVYETLNRGKDRSHRQTIINKSASLLYNLIHGHPFADGNKRTGFAVAEAFINANRYSIKGDEYALFELCLEIASAYGKSSTELKEHIKAWLKENLEPNKSVSAIDKCKMARKTRSLKEDAPSYSQSDKKFIEENKKRLIEELKRKGYKKGDNPMLVLGADVLKRRKNLMERLAKV